MNEQPAGRAIVTFSRGWQTLVAVRSLGRRGVEVITGDHYSMTPGSLSKYSQQSFKYPDPDIDPEDFIDAVEETVLKPGVKRSCKRQPNTTENASSDLSVSISVPRAPSKSVSLSFRSF